MIDWPDFMNVFADLRRDTLERAIGCVPNLDRRERQRKPSHNTILNRAKKAGASSVTIDGITYRFGEAIQSDTDRELAAFGARHGIA
jgi:hypothetical protein